MNKSYHPLFNPFGVKSDFQETNADSTMTDAVSDAAVEPETPSETVPAAPKRRGRPPKNKAQFENVKTNEPVAVKALTKRRGRPAKNKNDEGLGTEETQAGEPETAARGVEENAAEEIVPAVVEISDTVNAAPSSEVIEIVSNSGEKAEIVVGGIKINVSSAKIESKNGVTVLHVQP